MIGLEGEGNPSLWNAICAAKKMTQSAIIGRPQEAHRH